MDQFFLSQKYNLENCIQCKKCTRNCPSAKHNGIVPNEVVLEVREGIYSGDPWTCLMCHRCSMVCPKDIEVAELILEMRNFEVRNGNVPERFGRVYNKFKEVGDTMSIVAATDEDRASLGLSKIERDPDIPKKLEAISGGSK